MDATQPKKAPIEVAAFNFPAFGRPVPGARIRALGETTILAVTDERGRAVIRRPVGESLALVLEKPGFQATQVATTTVPPEGLLGRQRELTVQTLSTWFFKACKWWLRIPTSAGRHHLATTVTAAEKTLYDDIQGEPGATVRLTRDDGRTVDIEPIYLGVVPGVHKTDLVSVRFRRLAQTSADGGVLIPNLPPGKYTIYAEKPGRVFAPSTVIIGEDSPEFLNASPPWAPRIVSSPR